MANTDGHGFQLEEGETPRQRIVITQGGFAGFMINLLAPLMGQTPAKDGLVTDRRIFKRTTKGQDLSVPLAQVSAVYRNTSSDSLAVVDQNGRDGLMIARVANCDEVKAALTELGVTVEDESMSPRRRGLR